MILLYSFFILSLECYKLRLSYIGQGDLMTNTDVSPFLKWAGGKRQLLPVINDNLPRELKEGKIQRYIEPFVGGGAVFFDLIQKYTFEQVILNDYNKDLINLYTVIQNNVTALINNLKPISDQYLSLDETDRKSYFYTIRESYNETGIDSLQKAVYLLFLNKTCFNGLYRVNRKNHFNVLHGRYKNPTILNEKNLLSVSKALKNVDIIAGDFSMVDKYVNSKTFVYLDPPYRPLNSSSSFTSYSNNEFDDKEQIRLSEFFVTLDNKGAKLMLSNSDPKNANQEDDFFDKLYENYNIKRVSAKRSINSNSNGRGKINELLITNY